MRRAGRPGVDAEPPRHLRFRTSAEGTGAPRLGIRASRAPRPRPRRRSGARWPRGCDPCQVRIAPPAARTFLAHSVFGTPRQADEDQVGCHGGHDRDRLSYSVPLLRPRWCMIAHSGNHRRPRERERHEVPRRPQQPTGAADVTARIHPCLQHARWTRRARPSGDVHGAADGIGPGAAPGGDMCPWNRPTRKNRRPDRVASSMRAIVYAQTGDSSVFELVERDAPRARAGRGQGEGRRLGREPHRLEGPRRRRARPADAVPRGRARPGRIRRRRRRRPRRHRVRGRRPGLGVPRGPRAADRHGAGVRGAAGRSGRAASGCRELRHRGIPRRARDDRPSRPHGRRRRARATRPRRARRTHGARRRRSRCRGARRDPARALVGGPGRSRR